MKAVNLETKRLFLERLTLKHLSKKYVDWLNDPEVYKFLESGGDYSIKKLEEYLAEQEQKDIFCLDHISQDSLELHQCLLKQ